MSISVGIIGGTGYTGVELLRLLAQHPQVELKVITSRSEAGTKVVDMYPNLRGFTDIKFTKPDIKDFKKCELIFSATPNGIAMKYAKELLDANIRFIDLAADFRFKDVELWSKWYGMQHACADLLPEAVYGLCEVNRQQILKAQLVGNPGCYPTAVQLALLPLIEKDLIELDDIIADCKSGVSGAGRGANVGTLQAESAENFKAYALSGHRHQPEIEHNLAMSANSRVDVTFIPHLVPMIRGIHATVYVKLKDANTDLQKLFEDRYQNEIFVDVLPAGSQPETKWVKGANGCKIAIHKIKDSNRVVILSVIDNLVKGAAGQAIQNMNIMFGLKEDSGLGQIALMP